MQLFVDANARTIVSMLKIFFITGYTFGGAPYGVTWEEMGLKPWDNLEENE